jgi:hypothetical protein
MPSKKKDKLVKKALVAAKALEKIPEPTEKEIVKIYREGLEEARKLQKLLKPEWFVEDTDKQGKKLKKK